MDVFVVVHLSIMLDTGIEVVVCDDGPTAVALGQRIVRDGLELESADLDEQARAELRDESQMQPEMVSAGGLYRGVYSLEGGTVEVYRKPVETPVTDVSSDTLPA